MKTIKSLLGTLPQRGRVTWIGLRPGRDIPIDVVQRATITCADGLVGDRFNGRRNTTRQVTLIQAEHLYAVASMLGREASIDPSVVRRNIVVTGLNLLALKDKRFTVGGAVLEMTGLCHPCSKMETALGPGGYNAMRGHGGITARVIREGSVEVGDEVAVSAGAPRG